MRESRVLRKLRAGEVVSCVKLNFGDAREVSRMTRFRLLDARQRVAETARKHGKFAGTVGSADNLGELIGLGYRFISVGADVVALMRYFEDIAAAFAGEGDPPETKSVYSK